MDQILTINKDLWGEDDSLFHNFCEAKGMIDVIINRIIKNGKARRI